MSEENRGNIEKGLKLLQKGLYPYAEREMKSTYGVAWKVEVEEAWATEYGDKWQNWDDIHTTLWIMLKYWNKVFMKHLSHDGRTWVNEAMTVRNRWAHMEEFDNDSGFRAIDTFWRLLRAVGAPEAEEAERLRRTALQMLVDGGDDSGNGGDSGSTEEAEETGGEPPAPPPGGYKITKCRLGFKAKLYVVDFTAMMDGYKVRYYGRFRSNGSIMKEMEFTVNPAPKDPEELREKALGFIAGNWSGPDEVKASFIGDKQYSIEIGEKAHYTVAAKVPRNKAGKVISFEFERSNLEAMVPFGDIIAVMHKKIMAG